jgi:hypothetical protein
VCVHRDGCRVASNVPASTTALPVALGPGRLATGASATGSASGLGLVLVVLLVVEPETRSSSLSTGTAGVTASGTCPGRCLTQTRNSQLAQNN